MLTDQGKARVKKAFPTPPPHQEEIAALSIYTTGYFLNQNKTLRGEPLNKESMSRYDQTKDKINQTNKMAIAALNSMPDFNGTVYRGANLPQSIIDQYKPGEMIQEKGFVSTSQTKKAAYNGNTRFIIASKTGTDISKISAYEKEKEVVMKPNTAFKVLKKKARGGITTIYLEEI